MNTKALHLSIVKIVGDYKAELLRFSEDEFLKQPTATSWSLSQIYFHIFDASSLSLQAINDISEGREERGDATTAAKLIFFFGSLPPMKFKAPRVFLARLKSISIPEAQELIEVFETKLTFTLKLLDGINLVGRVRHPRLGSLNANQWLKFTEIHLKHHLKQVKRTKVLL